MKHFIALYFKGTCKKIIPADHKKREALVLKVHYDEVRALDAENIQQAYRKAGVTPEAWRTRKQN